MEKFSEEELEFTRLASRNPHLRERMKALFRVAESTHCSSMKADDIEVQLREEIDKLGHQIFENWAANAANDKAKELSSNCNIKKHGKKNFTGNPHSEG